MINPNELKRYELDLMREKVFSERAFMNTTVELIKDYSEKFSTILFLAGSLLLILNIFGVMLILYMFEVLIGG